LYLFCFLILHNSLLSYPNNDLAFSASYLVIGLRSYLPDDELFFVSGAQTASWRVLGNSKYWYQDEELLSEELEEAFALYEETRPSIVVSHEAPLEAGNEVLGGTAGSYFAAKANTVSSRTCAALQKMFEAHRPQRWYFGHYHLNKGFGIAGTVFECLAELSVSEIPTEACSQLSSDG
jgi:hypothetical protein